MPETEGKLDYHEAHVEQMRREVKIRSKQIL